MSSVRVAIASEWHEQLVEIFEQCLMHHQLRAERNQEVIDKLNRIVRNLHTAETFGPAMRLVLDESLIHTFRHESQEWLTRRMAPQYIDYREAVTDALNAIHHAQPIAGRP